VKLPAAARDEPVKGASAGRWSAWMT